MRPAFTVVEAEALVKELYGFEGSARPLPSYSDQNFLIATGDRKVVLKISNSSETKQVLDFQQGALKHLQIHAPQLNTPCVVPTVDGSTLNLIPARAGTASFQEAQHVVWMVDFLPGRFISDLPSYPPGLLESLGAFMGALDKALASFSHPAMNRNIVWDLQNVLKLTPLLDHIKDSNKRNLVVHFLERFENHVLPHSSRLRSSVIHNDANDNNVLVSQDTEQPGVKGIIDFGDMVHSFTVGELAIACAYMMLDKENPVLIASYILKGYQDLYPLNETEVTVLFDLICLRLCTSVCMSTRERSLNPGNEYLAISEQPAWNTLAKLVKIDPVEATERFSQYL